MRWNRMAVVVALVAGVTLTGAGAHAQPRGASTSNFEVDIVVRGTPPPGAEVTVTAPDSDPAEYPFALADAAGVDDLIIVSGTVYRSIHVDPGADAGASRVRYACTMAGGPVTPPLSTCTGVQQGDEHWPTGHVDAWFQGNANAYARSTITFTFGRCDGRAPTVLLSDDDAPTNGPDVILGTAGRDEINALGGNDVICGGGGPDVIRGGAGQDRVLGGNGADRIEGGDLRDVLYGQYGNDTILGMTGNDLLDGGPDRDACNGGQGADQGPRCESRTAIP